MKPISWLILLVGLSFAGAPSCLGQAPPPPDWVERAGPGAHAEPIIPLAPEANALRTFWSRLEAAILRRDLPAVWALYQTDGVAAQERERELAKWQRMFNGEVKGGATIFAKELARLPPQARRFWGDMARRLSERDVTHLVHVRFVGGQGLMLPLVTVGDALLMVPSAGR